MDQIILEAASAATERLARALAIKPESQDGCDFLEGYNKGYSHGAEWQKEQSNWINVNEQLPSLLSYVLVYNTEGARLVARRFENGWWALFADGEHLMGELAPLYWQPLPAPPGKLLQD